MGSSVEDDAWLGIVNFHCSQLVPLENVEPDNTKHSSADGRKGLQEAKRHKREQYLRKRRIQCPLCGYTCSSANQNSSLGTDFLNHISRHKSSFDPSVYKACCVCFLPVQDSSLGDYCGQCPKDIADCTSPRNYLEIVDYSCSVNRYMTIVARAKAIANSRHPQVISYPSLPSESLFKAVVMNGSYANFVEYQEKMCPEIGKYAASFRFKCQSVRSRLIWCCIFCTDKFKTVGFNNDISLRIHVLYHMQQFHSNYPELMRVVIQEWEIMNKEFFCSVNEIFPMPMAALNTIRPALVYVSKVCERSKAIINEMFRRESRSALADEGCVCNMCFAPLRYRLNCVRKHMELAHNVKTLSGHSDFNGVDEIASCSNITADNFPAVLLRHSEQFRCIGDNSTVFYKWKCLLPCSTAGHINDVLEFPSTLLLRMYALRHLQNFHMHIFSDDFFEREWGLVSSDSGLNGVDFRNYDQSSYENVNAGSDDPNDFVFPYLMYMLPPDIRNFLKICGVCYWAGLHNQFLEHIVVHGYRISSKFLSSNSSLKEVLDTYGIKRTNGGEVKTLPDVPVNILGSIGRNWLVSIRNGSFSINSISGEFASGGNERSDLPGLIEDNRPSRKSAVNAKKRLKDVSIDLNVGDYSSSCSSSNGDSNSDNYDLSGSDDDFNDDILAVKKEDIESANRDKRSSTYLAQSTTVSSAVDLDILELSSTNKDKYEKRLDARVVARITHNMSQLFSVSVRILENLDPSDLAAIQLIIDRRCPICPNTPKVRMPDILPTVDHFTVEEAVFGHLIVKHSSDKFAQKLLQIKCCQLMKSQIKFPPSFLLKADEKGLLRCSVCTERTFPKMNALRSHFSNCCKRHSQSMKDNPPSKSKRICSEIEMNSCPMESCDMKWKTSTLYSTVVSQIRHILMHHMQCASACEKALEMSVAAECKHNFPYLDVEESIKQTTSSNCVMFACATCLACFKGIEELVQHARRYHEKDALKTCAFGCSNIRLVTAVSDFVSEADMIFFHHLLKHPAENLVKWFETWSWKKDMNNGKFHCDIQASLEYVTSGKEFGLFCSHVDCKGIIIKNNQDILSHMHDDVDEPIPSAAAKRLVAACMNKQSVEQVKQPNVERRKGRMDYKLNIICRLCKRSIPRNSLYSCDQMSYFIHCIVRHPRHVRDMKWDQRGISLSFPFIDVESTGVRCIDKGSSVFVCSICGIENITSKGVLDHALFHEGIVTGTSKRHVECTQCSETISFNGVFSSEQFSILAHAVNYHSSDMEFLNSNFAALRDNLITDEDDVLNLLDGEASLRMCCEKGNSCFVCLECRQDFSNSLAFLHHSKQHIPRFVNKISYIMPCFDRSRKAESYTGKLDRIFYCHLCERKCSFSGFPSLTFNLSLSMMTHLIFFHANETQVERYVDRQHAALACVFPFLDSKMSYRTKKLHCVKCPQKSFIREAELLRHSKRDHHSLLVASNPQETTPALSSGSEDIFDRSHDELSETILPVLEKQLLHNPDVHLRNISFNPADLELTQEQLPGSLLAENDVTVPRFANCGAAKPSDLETLANNAIPNLELTQEQLPGSLLAENNVTVFSNCFAAKLSHLETQDTNAIHSCVAEDIRRLVNNSVFSLNSEDCREEASSVSAVPGSFTPQQRRSPRRSAIRSTASSPKSGPIRRHRLNVSRVATQTPKTSRKVIRIGFDEVDGNKTNAALIPEKGQTRIDRFLQKRDSLLPATLATSTSAETEVSIVCQKPHTSVAPNTMADITCDLPASTRSLDLVTDWLNSKCLSDPRITPRRIAEPLFLQDNTGTLYQEFVEGSNLKTVLDGIMTPDIQLGTSLSNCSVASLLPSSRLKGLNPTYPSPVDISHLENVSGFKCLVKDCNFVGLTRNDTREHMRTRHCQTPVSAGQLIARDVVSPCVICDQVFSNRVKLLTHIGDFHKSEKQPYPCAYCSQLFATVQRVREHERRIHEWSMKSNSDENLFCSICNEKFANPRNVKEHMKRSHRKRPANYGT